jgi:hypothetical protein
MSMMQASVFDSLFPSPTGQNGLEELVRAAELLTRSRAGQELDQAKAPTLSELQNWFADGSVRQAVAWMRQGLKKDVRSPRSTLATTTLFPEYALLRRLARLLRHQSHLAYAEGRHADAVRACEDGLRLGYVTCYDSLIGGMVGAAILSISLSAAMRHRQQWSAPDCDRFLRLSREWLAAPDPFEKTWAGERQFFEELMVLFEKNPRKFLDSFEIDEEKNQTEIHEVVENLKDDAAGRARIAVQIRTKYDEEIATQKRFIADPSREIPKEKQDFGIVDRLMNEIGPSFGQVMPQFVEMRVKIQLLGVHGALQRHFWEKNSYPDGLNALKLGDFMVDPCTRQALLYRKTQESYELSSAGLPDPERLGKRKPITV